MPGLSHDDPDFASLCLEMYSLISISPFKTEPLRYEKNLLKEKTTREKKQSEIIGSGIVRPKTPNPTSLNNRARKSPRLVTPQR